MRLGAAQCAQGAGTGAHWICRQPCESRRQSGNRGTCTDTARQQHHRTMQVRVCSMLFDAVRRMNARDQCSLTTPQGQARGNPLRVGVQAVFREQRVVTQ